MISGTIITFPVRPRRRKRGKAGAKSTGRSAVVRAFPPGRDRRLVIGVAREMREQINDDAAQDLLIEHLNREGLYYERIGVAEDEVEHVLSGFSVLVWLQMVRGEDAGEGVA